MNHTALRDAPGYENHLVPGGVPWQTPERITCRLHHTLIEHCIDEHGLELLTSTAREPK